jgi:hypothetical protein
MLEKTELIKWQIVVKPFNRHNNYSLIMSWAPGATQLAVQPSTQLSMTCFILYRRQAQSQYYVWRGHLHAVITIAHVDLSMYRDVR